ncbi:hypothetical protein H5410_003418 [Solanum commersonii]|uniref:Uncharacterized protein n=1 Tax=Solanum commersonii TaxID=4109 RepID=A0A9J6B4M3_SOLCO|nr:hypothetical protein H5410_003418 [Solanum commersonii]
MIPYSHTKVNQFKIKNQMQCSHSKMRNTMHVFTHRFALIFQLTFDSAYSRSKRDGVKKGPIYAVSLSVGVSVADGAVYICVSVPEAVSD